MAFKTVLAKGAPWYDIPKPKEEAVKKAKELSKSTSIYTREELKKMSRAAEERPSYRYDAPLPVLDQYVQLLQEVLAGERVRFLYLMPYRF